MRKSLTYKLAALKEEPSTDLDDVCRLFKDKTLDVITVTINRHPGLKGRIEAFYSDVFEYEFSEEDQSISLVFPSYEGYFDATIELIIHFVDCILTIYAQEFQSFFYSYDWKLVTKPKFGRGNLEGSTQVLKWKQFYYPYHLGVLYADKDYPIHELELMPKEAQRLHCECPFCVNLRSPNFSFKAVEGLQSKELEVDDSFSNLYDALNFPESVKTLELDFEKCGLKFGQSEYSQFINLQCLELRGFPDLPTFVLGDQRLRRLAVVGLKNPHIPEEISTMKNLGVLSINTVSGELFLPTSFQKLKKIHKLSFDSIAFEEVPESLLRFRSLEKLHFNNSTFKTGWDSFPFEKLSFKLREMGFSSKVSVTGAILAHRNDIRVYQYDYNEKRFVD